MDNSAVALNIRGLLYSNAVSLIKGEKMNNYEKIKKLLEYGFWAIVESGEGEFGVFLGMNEDEELVCGEWTRNKKEALKRKFSDSNHYNEDEIKSWEKDDDEKIVSIEAYHPPMPMLENGDEVQVLKALKDWGGVTETQKELVGKTGKITERDCGDYEVTPEKGEHAFIPVQFVAPIIEDEKDMVDIDGKEYSKATIKRAMKEYNDC